MHKLRGSFHTINRFVENCEDFFTATRRTPVSDGIFNFRFYSSSLVIKTIILSLLPFHTDSIHDKTCNSRIVIL